MAKHTPGPWSIWKNSSRKQTAEGLRHMLDVHQGTLDNYGRAIANVISGGPQAKAHDYDDVMANALLIAAAPELLEIVRDMAEYGGAMKYAEWRNLVQRADTAIAKATGAERSEASG